MLGWRTFEWSSDCPNVIHRDLVQSISEQVSDAQLLVLTDTWIPEPKDVVLRKIQLKLPTHDAADRVPLPDHQG